MNDMEFDAFLESIIKENGREFIDYNEEWDKPHVFSRSFERKMRRLIGKQERYGFYPSTRLPLRKAIMVAAIVIITMTMLVVTVSAFGEAIWGFIMSIFDTHTHVTMEVNEEAPDTIMELYEISKLPDGYSFEQRVDLTYETNVIYNDGVNQLLLKQSVKKYYDYDVDTENKIIIPINVGGHSGFIIENDGYCHLEWETERYVFVLVGAFGKDELISIAETVQ